MVLALAGCRNKRVVRTARLVTECSGKRTKQEGASRTHTPGVVLVGVGSTGVQYWGGGLASLPAVVLASARLLRLWGSPETPQ